MAFADLTVKLKGDITDFANKMDSALKQANKFRNTLGSGMSSKGSGWASQAGLIKEKYKEATKELTAHNLGLKDTSRIIQGIMVSQMFYSAVQSIRTATSALWDFNVALDYMKVTYSALFGNTKLAEDFMSVLQEHSIETIFDYQGLADASKKLLAYGIDYENLMFIMEGLTNLGAMSGDPAALDRIALALGQIYTKGKLSAEEMRQLANAYIPITEILQEKFGLTGDQLKRVGDLNLPAANVINAIVDYANENFGSVGDAAMLTITGLQNRIVDTLKVVGSAMIQPLTSAYKSFLAYVAKGLESIRSAYDAGGIGGVFEHLVPDPSAQRTIRQFVANIVNLFNSLMSVGAVVGRVFGNFAHVVANAFNILAPIVSGFVNLLSLLIDRFLSTEAGAFTLRTALILAAGAFVLLKVQALGALIITAVTKAVEGLTKGLIILGSVITKHPILSLLVLLAAGLIGVSASSKNANNSISNLFDTLAGGVGGTTSADIFKETEKEIEKNSDAADQFNNRLKESEERTKAFKDALKGVNATAKKTGGLLSFDEVFKLPDNKSGSGVGSTVLDDIDALNKGLSNLAGDFDLEIPDFSQYISDFTDGLFGGLSTAISEKFTNFDLVDGINVGAGIWGAISRAIAKAGGTATLGTVLKNAFTEGGIKGLWTALAGTIKTTGLKGLVKGGVLGLAVSFVVDMLAGIFFDWLGEEIEGANDKHAKIGQTIGGVIGAVVGGLIGGPVGLMIGSAVGTFAAGLVGMFDDEIMKFLTEDSRLNWGTIFGAIFGGPSSVAIGTQLYNFFVAYKQELIIWASETKLIFSTWWDDTTAVFTSWWDDTTAGFTSWWDGTFGGLAAWWEDTKAVFTTWDGDTRTRIATWWEETKGGFASWFMDTATSLATWALDTKTELTVWYNNTKNTFDTWVADISSALTTWFYDGILGFITWHKDTKTELENWWTETKDGFASWFMDNTGGFAVWFVDTKTGLTNWWTETKAGFVDWITGNTNGFSTFWSETKSGFTTWLSSTRLGLTKWWTTTKEGFTTWLSDTWTGISTWFFDTKEAVKNSWNALWDPKTWKSGWDSVKSWFSDLWTGISNWFTDIGKSIGKWWNGLWDDKEVSVNTSSSGGGSKASLSGHAAGGIFNREHIARFAEGNKAEAIIPLENRSAMQPFVDAVSGGIVSSLAPIVANINAGGNSNLPPLYVGTLIADDRGIRELYKKFEVIQLQENDRRGLNATV